MAEASLRALIADLLGEDPDAPSPRRPTVAEALRRCPIGELLAARDGTEEVAVGRLADGRGVVVPDRCPHDGGPLSDGFVEGDSIVCARHGWEFDAASGACAGRPRVRLPVRALPCPARAALARLEAPELPGCLPGEAAVPGRESGDS